MKKSPELELDNFIDSLNLEQRPDYSEDKDTAELQETARLVRGLRPAEGPSPMFTESLYHKLPLEGAQLPKTRRRFLPWAALVACFLAIALIVSPWPLRKQDIVLAMEQTVQQLQNYHGTMEKISSNQAGDKQVYENVEIWSEGNKYATRDAEGTMTVNNGEQHWTVQPNLKEVVLLPVYLDTHDFDLRQEAEKAAAYPHKAVGQDSIAGRLATRIQVTPPGGASYFLWVDVETKLPIQLQTAMQKAVQTTFTFVSFEPNTQIPTAIFSYNPPQGYKIIDKNQDKQVKDIAEASQISGLTPIVPKEIPQKIMANKNRIVFDCGDTVVTETLASSPLVLAPTASLGQAPGGQLEVLTDSLRWQQDGLEIKVQGKRAEDLAKQLNDKLVLPQAGQGISPTPAQEVTVDMEVEKRNQQQVDAGSSPWQLDPTQVAFTFVALKMSPGGINGNPPLAYTSLKLTTNTGKEAIVQVQEGPIKTVYLKRLVRQDDTGIWTVVGYDPK
ncbi:sigma-E factor regulatory protein RseB domain-containing protein [Desulfosporosinus sp. PR]|uniref:LolA family protein n=1 Tax=Candidatus Desulfosporosinus nitrosoreducens TaxID=3401928 RepID=UPI0027E67F9D|nr:sigma-E factor regulatory protein RseB domain-containing protein [Desulfosporosinus sp. PR]MDQ7092031.1 sigma-E factor regulatory protein RseB domain-containing protein [Desulfosporosinus sp. PR]